MASTFTWMDYSEQERRDMLRVIKLFDEPGVRDELGLAVLRDIYSNRFFPGVSVVQTRARYFLFTAWHMLWVEDFLRRNGARTQQQIAKLARDEEVRLIKTLVQAETEGVIGVNAGINLKRLPSDMYWSGLGILRIRRFAESQQQYFQALADRGPPPRTRLVAEVPGEVREIASGHWDPALPGIPKGFPGVADFTLRPEEASYLQDRIRATQPHSLLGWLVAHARSDMAVDFPWLHSSQGEFPEAIKASLFHARRLSEVMHGAAWLYNLMLAEECQREDKEAKVEEYRLHLAEWIERIESNRTLDRWLLHDFWTNVTQNGELVHPRTRKFVDSWIQLMQTMHDGASIADNAQARAMLRERERQVKPSLHKLGNAHLLRHWNGKSFTQQFSYRWHTARTIIHDIVSAQEDRHVAA